MRQSFAYIEGPGPSPSSLPTLHIHLLLIPPFHSHLFLSFLSLPFRTGSTVTPPEKILNSQIHVGEFYCLLDKKLSTLLHYVSACHIIISSKWAHLLQGWTFLCLFKSSINVLPCSTQVRGFKFYHCYRNIWLSVCDSDISTAVTAIAVSASKSRYNNSWTLNTSDGATSILYIAISLLRADNTYTWQICHCYYIRCMCSPLIKATNWIATKYCMLQNTHNRPGPA
jgi:hypothetical protein